MISVDHIWGETKNLDNFQALILATIVGGFDKYETIYEFWSRKIVGQEISDALDYLLAEGWIQIDKRTQDVFILSETGRYHYATHKHRPKTRKAGEKVVNEVKVPLLAKAGEVVKYEGERWLVQKVSLKNRKTLFDLSAMDSNRMLSGIDGRFCINVIWGREVYEYFKKVISDNHYAKYAEHWAIHYTKEWFKYNMNNDWTVKMGNTRKPMEDWRASVRTWVMNEVKSISGCRFRLPHPGDPQHPSNLNKVAYGSIPGVKEVAARISE